MSSLVAWPFVKVHQSLPRLLLRCTSGARSVQMSRLSTFLFVAEPCKILVTSLTTASLSTVIQMASLYFRVIKTANLSACSSVR